MALKVYAADQVAVTFAGILLEAEGDDQFVTITKTNDTFTYKEGVNGFGTRSRRKGKLYRVEVTLPQTSEKNALLSLLHKADQESNGSGVAPLGIIDTNGTSVFVSPESWIVKIPDWSAAAEADVVTWMWDCHNGDMLVGGN